MAPCIQSLVERNTKLSTKHHMTHSTQQHTQSSANITVGEGKNCAPACCYGSESCQQPLSLSASQSQSLSLSLSWGIDTIADYFLHHFVGVAH